MLQSKLVEHLFSAIVHAGNRSNTFTIGIEQFKNRCRESKRFAFDTVGPRESWFVHDPNKS
jgi:hypothetical protein